MKKILILAILIGILALVTAASAQLPGNVSGKASYPAVQTNSYMDVYIYSGGNAALPDSPPYYAGWCPDPARVLLNDQNQTWQVYSTLSPLPSFIPPANWNAINWLMNNDAGYDAHVIQTALFRLENSTASWTPVNTTQVNTLVTAAEAHSTFVPAKGQVYVIYLWNSPLYQGSLITETVPSCNQPKPPCNQTEHKYPCNQTGYKYPCNQTEHKYPCNQTEHKFTPPCNQTTQPCKKSEPEPNYDRK